MSGPRRQVAEPPREGLAASARYHLLAGSDLAGWTDSRRTAIAWRRGFGPGAEVSVWDAVRREPVVPVVEVRS